jgi:DNA polymerase-3 subunit gamma/tau
MIRITFNAEAEKIIRRELVQAGHPSRFAIVPGEGLAPAGTSRASAPAGSIENEARNHPLVTRALDLFEAEIVSVIDLRPRG